MTKQQTKQALGFKDWKAKYYPVPASKFRKSDWSEALEHSIAKWRGLRPSVLKRYHIELSYGKLLDVNDRLLLEINDKSCALCQRAGRHRAKSCDTCPLYEIRGGAQCDERRGGERIAPYHELSFSHRGDPEPMLEWLVRARRLVKKEARHDRRRTSRSEYR
jgi:hypothetical protein